MRANRFRRAAGTPAEPPGRRARPASRPSPAPSGRRRAPGRTRTAWSCAGRLRAWRAILHPSGTRSLLPQVEQAAGDDVALHFAGAAVDGGGPRVQVLGAPLTTVEFDDAGQ